MNTVTIRLPNKKSAALRGFDLSGFLQECVENYVEFQEDQQLRNELETNPKIDKLTRALAKKL